MSDTSPDLPTPDAPTASTGSVPGTLPHAGAADPPGFACRYELGVELARGGMGAVHRATDRALNREVAVKVMLFDPAKWPQLAQRFLEEARITGQLQHPGVPPVYDISQHADGRPFLAMKLIKGRTFSNLLKERVTPAHNRPQFLAIFEQVAQTVAYAHEHWVIHRDLKPSNIMAGAFGEVQVMDWGLAKVLNGSTLPEMTVVEPTEGGTRIDVDRHAGDETQQGSILGTPAYMSPEQARGEIGRLSARTDVFALGAILCEVLTGEPAYVGGQLEAKAALGQLDDAHARLNNCDADADLVALAKQCLSVDPATRPANAGEIAAAVAAFRAGVEERLRHLELEHAAAEVRAAERRKRRRIQVALALSLAASVLTVIGSWARMDSERRTRRAQLSQEVRDALIRANAFQEQARRNGNNAQTPEALEQAQRAKTLVQSGPTDPALAAEVEQLLAALDESRRNWQRDSQMRQAIEEVRLSKTSVKDGRFDMSRAESGYEAAFREYGIDLRALGDAAIIERIGAKPITPELAAALADWSAIRLFGRGPDDAVGLRLLAVAQAADPDPWRQSFREALRTNNAGGLRRLADRLKQESQPAAATAVLADLLRHFGDLPSAIRVNRLGVARYPSDFWLNHNLAMALFDVAPLSDEALRFAAAAATLRPQSPGARLNLGVVLFRRGAWQEAADEYLAAVRLKDDYAEAHYSYGAALLQLGRADDALREFRRARELRPGFPQINQDIAMALATKGDWPEAAKLWEEVTREALGQATPYYNLGNALAKLHRHRDAIAAYQQALVLDPQYAEAWCNLGLLLRNLGRFDEAVEKLTRGHEIGSGRPDWRYPSAAWLSNAVELRSRDARLQAVFRGQPANVAELLRQVEFAFSFKHDPVAALTLDHRAAEQQPALRMNWVWQLQRSVMTADALRKLADADEFDAAMRAHWRQGLLAVLRADLSQCEKLSVDIGAMFAREIDARQRAAAFAELRDPEQLANLPDDERQTWTQYWHDAEAFRKRATDASKRIAQ